jgi:hypothetical protein
MGMAKSYTLSKVKLKKKGYQTTELQTNSMSTTNKSFKMAQQQGGCIQPFERETDDSVSILGADLKIQVAHSQGVRNTEQRGLVVRTKQNYRNWIKEMYVFFSLNYKDYYNVVVQKHSEDDCVSLDLFHYMNTHNLIYTGINVGMVKAFLMHKKQKGNGNTHSHVQVCKYHNTFLWSLQQAKQLLPRAYYLP